MSDVIKVRVQQLRKSHFPFDIFYLFRTQDLGMIRKVFPWSLGVPPSEARTRLLEEARLRMLKVQGYKEWPVLESLWQDRVLVVPILPKQLTRAKARERIAEAKAAKQQSKKKLFWGPSYLGHKEDQTRSQHQRRGRSYGVTAEKPRYVDILDDELILFTPMGPVRPPCILCSQHFAHMAGNCVLGDPACFKYLTLAEVEKDIPIQQGDSDGNSSVHAELGGELDSPAVSPVLGDSISAG